MILHACPYCSKQFPVHWTECGFPYLRRGAPQNYQGPEVFCPHCRKLARFTDATLVKTVAAAIGSVALPIACVLLLGLDEKPVLVGAAAILGVVVAWFVSATVCCRSGELAAYSEQPK